MNLGESDVESVSGDSWIHIARDAERADENAPSDAGSEESMLSSSGPKCFLPGTCLPLADGGYRLIDQIQEGDDLKGASGQVLRVTRRTKHIVSSPIEVVTITTRRGCQLKVTADHRIVTPHAPGAKQAAGDLKEGDSVALSHGAEDEISALDRMQIADGAVYEIGLSPDEPIEAFVEPQEKVLSMGRQAKTRRSRGTRRAGDGASIPDTDDGFNCTDQQA